ncbi:MAG: DNA gyrase inhibitor YacG [Alphaproteobacteria bacterium]|nr:DNA gyrase inhibitor YacG [Alphaproteobacteria bacterium]MCY4230616.1 DNA gyrase inhibitor YacG [Alphaproteobacteria bacterium]MCY4319409.1 DNA gyrase inhibitor YacG [Alphaproteobacteria bacterium]
MAQEPVKLRPFGFCPICGRPAVEATRPFCSSNCRHLDLGRWLNEGYIIQAGGGLGGASAAELLSDEDDG